MNKLVAEALGTFGLVLCGTGACVVDQETGGALGVTGIAIAFGLIVTAMIHVFGPFSGAHLNPAVTLALFFGRYVRGSNVLPYIGAQCIGAVSASLFVRALFPANELLGATLPSGKPWVSFGLETLLTFFLMLVILAPYLRARPAHSVFIGGTVLLEAFFAGPVSGASMNPARSLAPALVSGHLEHLWIYIAAPVLGALVAVPVHHLLFNAKHEAGA
jgi:aquaporin NIP